MRISCFFHNIILSLFFIKGIRETSLKFAITLWRQATFGTQMSCLLRCKTRRHKLCIAHFRINTKSSLTPLFLLSPKSLTTFRGPRYFAYSSVLRDLHREGAKLIPFLLVQTLVEFRFLSVMTAIFVPLPSVSLNNGTYEISGGNSFGYYPHSTVKSRDKCTLEVIKKIEYRFFGFVFFFGRYLCRRYLHKLQ